MLQYARTSINTSQVLLFYRRIQSGTYNRKWKIATWAAILFTIAQTLGLCLALVFSCSPTKAYWKAYNEDWATKHEYYCPESGYVNLLAGILSIVTDLYSIVLPFFMLRKLNIPKRQKISLNLVFGLSLTTVAAAAARTNAYYKMSQDYDFTW